MLEPLGVGTLGLTPNVFWSLTPREIRLKAEAHWEAERTKWKQIAWQTAHLLNVSGKSLKQDVTAEDLLGIPEPEKKADPAEWERLKKEFGF